MKAILALALLSLPVQIQAQDCSKLITSPMYTASSKTTHTRTLAQNKKGAITSNLYLTRVDRKDTYYFYMWVETYTTYKVEYLSGTRLTLKDGTKYLDLNSHITQTYDSSIGLFRTLVTLDMDTAFLSVLQNHSIDRVLIGERIDLDVTAQAGEFKDSIGCLINKGV